jgi:hypothetical protein
MRGLSQSEGLYPSDWILICLLEAPSQSLDWQGAARPVKPLVCLRQNRRRLRRHLGQRVDLFQPVNYAIKFQPLGSIAHDPAHARPVKTGGVFDGTGGRLGTLHNCS